MAYIDKTQLNEAMYHEAFEKTSDLQKWDSGCWIRYNLFENVLKSIPTADVVKRKRGEWISHILAKGGKSIDRDVCSLCGKQYADAWSYNFCPNCGAKMRKETEDAEIH